ncbi:MAG TPA: AAA family ATPase [Negativicutes bacterium]|nr:AAA family ATPase [Negativicutes bacterium]
MALEGMDNYIRRVELLRDKVPSFSEYPFSLPIIRELSGLELHPKVTYFVGENGTGKSTILEAMATAYGFNPEGGTKNFKFSSMATHSQLHEYIRLVKGVRRPKDGFFLRAESFYNVATNIDELDREAGWPRVIDSYGGQSLHQQSHGEAFLSLFLEKFRGEGVYILDEPEAALSPIRQMTMIARLHELVCQGSQFIIATHSPIIMAYPEAMIYEIREDIKRVRYEDTDHYKVMRDFLDNRGKMLDILMNQ